MSRPTELSGKVITCVLPKGTSSEVLHALFEKGYTRANFAYARGFDIHDEPDSKTGIPKAVEKETLTLIAKDQQEGEELFDLVYGLANIGHLGGGLMYMSDLSGAMAYMLPQIDTEEVTKPIPTQSTTSAPPSSMAAKPRE